jgi:hypothetical protein
MMSPLKRTLKLLASLTEALLERASPKKIGVGFSQFREEKF